MLQNNHEFNNWHNPNWGWCLPAPLPRDLFQCGRVPSTMSYDNPKCPPWFLRVLETTSSCFSLLLHRPTTCSVLHPSCTNHSPSSGDTLPASHASYWWQLRETWGCPREVCVPPLVLLVISKPISPSPLSPPPPLVLAQREILPLAEGQVIPLSDPFCSKEESSRKFSE